MIKNKKKIIRRTEKEKEEEVVEEESLVSYLHAAYDQLISGKKNYPPSNISN
jgi:hypothetical protein